MAQVAKWGIGRLARAAIALELFLGSGALCGGLALMAGPNGEILPLPVPALAGSPFHDYFAPGAILFAILGVGSVGAAALALRRNPIAPFLAFAAGGALLIWLAVEIAIVGYSGHPPLQAVYLGLGAVLTLVGAGWLHQVRFDRKAAIGAAALVFALGALPHAARADEFVEHRTRLALGFNVDLLPSALSAANGKLGYAPQVWLGIDHVRLRLVGAHLEPPDLFAFASPGFHHPTTTVLAAIIDYTFGPRLDGPWVGSGFEVWQNSIEHDGVPGTARWESTVFTVGGGYIWRFAGDFFLDPWAGAHLVLNPQTVPVGAFDYGPFPLQAEVSLKIGWFTPL